MQIYRSYLSGADPIYLIMAAGVYTEQSDEHPLTSRSLPALQFLCRMQQSLCGAAALAYGGKLDRLGPVTFFQSI